MVVFPERRRLPGFTLMTKDENPRAALGLLVHGRPLYTQLKVRGASIKVAFRYHKGPLRVGPFDLGAILDIPTGDMVAHFLEQCQKHDPGNYPWVVSDIQS
jgi:hypothetical protein